MPSKVMAWAIQAQAKAQTYPNSNTLYAHLVTAEPAITARYVSDCAIATGGNYVGITLQDINNNYSNRVISDGANGARYVMQNAVWTNLYLSSATPITGLIVTTGTSSGSEVYSYVQRLVSGVATPWTPPTTPPGAVFAMDLFTNGFWHMANGGV